MLDKLFGSNRNFSPLSVSIAIICVALIPIQILPGWFQLSGEPYSTASVVQFCLDNVQRSGEVIAIATVAILVVIFFMLIISAMSLLALAFAVLRDHFNQRRIAFWAFLFSILCSAGVFFAAFLANYFLSLNSYYLEAKFVSLSWFPYINFFVSFLCLVFLVPQLKSTKQYKSEVAEISNRAMAGSLSVITQQGKEAIGKATRETSTDEHAGKSDSINRLIGYMLPYKFQMFLAGLFIVIGAVCLAFAPYILGVTTDKILEIFVNGKMQENAYQDFLFSAIFLCVTYIGYSLFEYLGQFTLTYATEHTLFDLRALVDSKIKKLPLNYYDTHAIGDTLSRVTNDIDVIASALQQSVYVSVNSFVPVIIMFIMMLLINPALTFIAVIVVPLSLFVTVFIVKKAGKHFKGRQVSMGELNGFVEEAYEGHNVISACNKEEKVKSDFNKILGRLYNHSWRADFAASALMPITMSLTNFAYTTVTLIASFMVISGQFSIGMIQGFTQYMRNFGQPITDLAQISNIFQQTRAAAARVFEFVDEQEETPDKQDCVVPKDVKGIVEFEHVEFGYSPDKILIHDLSVNINPGDKVAIVGPTGAGKTTLVNLLLRFYEISKGQISVDGISTTDMTREVLRSNISMVLQDAWLFSGTIKENIRYGRLDATDEEVYAAAKEAQCHDFIKKLPGGYDFKLSESASNLAQGQKQLVTIARAILANCPILILDEATSSVDTRTEKLIQRAMANVMENRTSFVIAHRLSTIRDSELILYMQDGDILEQGNHRELMDKDGLYAKLYNSQF